MSLVDLISADVSLKRKGKDFVGLCPFHAEKTPSFTVSPDKEFYHCFGCGAHGDAIDWLRKVRGLSYQEACKQIGKVLGPDPWLERRKQIKAQLEWAYWTWRRAQWRYLLEREDELALDIEAAEIACRSITRQPATWTGDEQEMWCWRRSELYLERDLISNQLDLLQSYRHEDEVQTWWREQRGE